MTLNLGTLNVLMRVCILIYIQDRSWDPVFPSSTLGVIGRQPIGSTHSRSKGLSGNVNASLPAHPPMIE